MAKYADPSSVVLPNDPPHFRKELEELQKRGYDVRRCTTYHVKIGDVNYFLGKGTISLDLHTRYPEKGFKAQLELLDDKRNTPRLVDI